MKIPHFALAMLPLSGFALRVFDYAARGENGNLLWMCNAGNLVIGVGLLINGLFASRERTDSDAVRVARAADPAKSAPGLAAAYAGACASIGATLIRAAAPWLVFGIVPWIYDIVATGSTSLDSCLSHLGGTITAVLAVRLVGARRMDWAPALIFYLVCQHLARLFTPPNLNVNLAHQAYSGWESVFPVYWQYWLFTTAIAAGGLWATGFLLRRIQTIDSAPK